MRQSSHAPFRKFNIVQSEIQLQRRVSPGVYCESLGRQSAILGTEDGLFEVWVYPFKIASDVTFSVHIPQYHITVPAAKIAKTLIVRPELTTIVYSHDLFTIRQHLLAPLDSAGAVFLFDVDAFVPLEIWMNFMPNLIPMWPAGLGGQYSMWDENLNAYYLGEGTRKFAGLVGSPLAQQLSETPGHQLPDSPMQFVLKPTLEELSELFLPVIVAGSVNGKEEAVRTFNHLKDSIPALYGQHREFYEKFRAKTTQVETPVPELNAAIEWAKVSLTKGLVNNPQLGEGLVAGFGVSGKTHRPGFDWFFGGDAFLNSLAMNSVGDFEGVRKALALSQKHQRDDGKIFHELTQSAVLIRWFEDYPYGFYHAETTAYFIVAMFDYFTKSGDAQFARESWDSVRRAFRYCANADEDRDGLMENSAAGLAAMEVGEMLKKNRVDVYLAGVWLRALQCMIEFSEYFQEDELRDEARKMYDCGLDSFKKMFINEEEQRIHFAVLTNGDKHVDPTVWQSIPLFFNLTTEAEARTTLQDFARSDMCTDWGVRGVSKNSSYYDPISYNNGSVWPFTTGYVATAEYKHHRSFNGWKNLMANVRMTWLNALGWHTELLSGEYYCPVSASVPHQLFSATGIVLPLMKGLLGMESDAQKREIIFTPHFPMDWDEVQVKNYCCGENRFDFTCQRNTNIVKVKINQNGAEPFHLKFSPAFGLGTEVGKVTLNGKEHPFKIEKSRYDVHFEIECKLKGETNIEISFQAGIEFSLPIAEPELGESSKGIRLVDYYFANNIFEMVVQGKTSHSYVIPFRSGLKLKKVEGAEILKNEKGIFELKVDFSFSAKDYSEKIIRLFFE